MGDHNASIINNEIKCIFVTRLVFNYVHSGLPLGDHDASRWCLLVSAFTEVSACSCLCLAGALLLVMPAQTRFWGLLQEAKY